MAFNGAGTFQLVAGNPVVTGTVISSTWANNTLNDIAANGLSNCIAKDGQTTPTGNIPLGGFRITGMADAVNLQDAVNARQLQNGGLITLSAVSGTDTITAVASPTPAAYVAGQRFQFVAAGANTTTSVTLNISGLGAKNITKYGAGALAPGDIAPGQLVTVLYDGTQFQIQTASSVLPHGQCRLSVASTTSLKLSQYNGEYLIINGVPQAIPAAGVTVSNGGLSASTVYYAYAAMSGGAMVLNLSTTGHVTGSNGVEVKNGDATQTLVGMISTNASTQFVDSASQRFCLNWFNRRNLIGAVSGGPFSTSSLSSVEWSTSLRIQFLTWGDESARAEYSGNASNSGANAGTANIAEFDSSVVGISFVSPSPIAASGVGFIATLAATLSEGSHYSTLFGNAISAGTSTVNANGSVSIRG